MRQGEKIRRGAICGNKNPRRSAKPYGGFKKVCASHILEWAKALRRGDSGKSGDEIKRRGTDGAQLPPKKKLPLGQ
jgi:hypothetical protein